MTEARNIQDSVERYATHNPEVTVPEVLGRFRLDPNGENRKLVEEVLGIERADAEAPEMHT
jgi:hypothetical protein